MKVKVHKKSSSLSSGRAKRRTNKTMINYQVDFSKLETERITPDQLKRDPQLVSIDMKKMIKNASRKKEEHPLDNDTEEFNYRNCFNEHHNPYKDSDNLYRKINKYRNNSTVDNELNRILTQLYKCLKCPFVCCNNISSEEYFYLFTDIVTPAQ